MKQIALDFETFYDSKAGYSLRKMTPVEYILDPRFEVIGCTVKEDGGPTRWLEPGEIPGYLAKLPEKVLIASHNALFDMCILAWYYGYIPYLMADTLGMARAWLAAYLKSLSLASVARFLGLPAKGDTIMKVDGMRRDAIISAGLYEEYKAYCTGDTDLCWAVYRHIISDGFPASELVVMDTVLRACLTPKFVLDPYALAEHLAKVKADKQSLLERTGLTSRDDLMSNDKFAAALQSLGVDPPRKVSIKTGKETWAFAKTDPEFLALDEHPNPMVQALVAARLGIKSTIEETRTERFMKIAALTWPSNPVTNALPARQALLPMPLKFSGAHTHRLGGDWKLNVQNLPTRKDNTLRTTIKAPPGYKVVVVDASQIEARGVSSFCGCELMRMGFEQKKDIYSEFATSVFGRLVTKADKAERFVGKQAILGLGYSLGWIKFQYKVALDSLAQTGTEIKMDDAEAQRVVNLYRTTYREVPAMWKVLDNLIQQMTYKDCQVQLGPLTFLYQKIRLPNGLYLYYHNLRYEGDGWRFDYNGETKYIYGGKLLENIIQALSRIIIMDAAVRMRKKFNLFFNLQVHDELDYVVPEAIAEEVKNCLIEEMRVRPAWDPNWPLDAEGDIAESYGDAK